MILYTPMPLEAVLEGMEEFRPQYRELVLGEARLLVEDSGPGQCRVVRLISPRAEDYLDPRYQPGENIMVAGINNSK